ncbi:hypothetical protein RQP46_008522 [Phenoliferia psychrophenolica]
MTKSLPILPTTNFTASAQSSNRAPQLRLSSEETQAEGRTAMEAFSATLWNTACFVYLTAPSEGAVAQPRSLVVLDAYTLTVIFLIFISIYITISSGARALTMGTGLSGGLRVGVWTALVVVLQTFVISEHSTRPISRALASAQSQGPEGTEVKVLEKEEFMV